MVTATTRSKMKLLQEVEDVLNDASFGSKFLMIKKRFFFITTLRKVEVSWQLLVRVLREYKKELEEEIRKDFLKED